MEKITIDVTFINEILDYLKTRPYQDVFVLISKIISLNKQLQEKPKDMKTKE